MLRFDECASQDKVAAYVNSFGTPNDAVLSWGQPIIVTNMSIFEKCVELHNIAGIEFLFSTGLVDIKQVERALECDHVSADPVLHNCLKQHCFMSTETSNSKRARLSSPKPGMMDTDCASLSSIKLYFSHQRDASPSDYIKSNTVFESAVYLNSKHAVDFMLGLTGSKNVSMDVLARSLRMPFGTSLFPQIEYHLKSRQTTPFITTTLPRPAQVFEQPAALEPEDEAISKLRFVGEDCKNLVIVQEYLESGGGGVNDVLMWEGSAKTLFTWAAGLKATDVVYYLLQTKSHEINLESLFEARDFARRQHSFKLASAIEAVISRRRSDEGL